MVLRTNRLSVHRLTSADEHDMEKLLSDVSVMAYSFSPVMTQAESQIYLKSAIERYEKYGCSIYAVSQVEDGLFIGYAGFTHYEGLDSRVEIELGYRLLPQFWGKGFATEVASALLYYGYNELGFNRMISLIREGNEASINVAKKLGAVLQKKLPVCGYPALVYVHTKDDAIR